MERASKIMSSFVTHSCHVGLGTDLHFTCRPGGCRRCIVHIAEECEHELRGGVMAGTATSLHSQPVKTTCKMLRVPCPGIRSGAMARRHDCQMAGQRY